MSSLKFLALTLLMSITTAIPASIPIKNLIKRDSGFSAGWGFTQDEGTSTYVVDAVTILQVPEQPDTNDVVRFIWPGMQTSQDGLIQTVLGTRAGGWCGSDTSISQWCIFTGLMADEFTHGTAVTVNPGDYLVLDYKYTPDNGGQVTQTVTRPGSSDVLSQYTSAAPLVGQYVFCMECAGSTTDTITMPDTTFWNTTVTLASPNPDLVSLIKDDTVRDYQGFTTSDGGTTWFAPKVEFQEHQCTPGEFVPANPVG
ncbi:MAG: hypothetical protein M1820_010312 [Bogoriella megaspora]|nr:MAG: hypothetical protein M1820_010312 [Bogoriella megaspora]